MSALGSSVINKSGKKFAPKAPARRPAAPASAQSSTRPSVDRQLHSQTPQPQSIQQRVAYSPTHSGSLPNVASSQQHATTVLAKPSPRDGVTSIPIPSRSTPAPKHASSASAVPENRLSSPPQVSCRPTPVSQPLTGVNRSSEPSDLEPMAHKNNPKHTNSHKASFPLSTEFSSGSLADTISMDVSAPAVKRRRVEKSPEQNQVEESRTQILVANVPIPSTETNEIVELSSNTPVPAVSNKPSISVQEKSNQHITVTAAKVAADATRSSSARAKKPRISAKGKNVQRGKGTSGNAIQDSPSQAEEGAGPAKARKYTRRKTLQSIEDAAAKVVEIAVQGSSKDSTMRGRRRKVALTPEGAEALRITPSEVRMMDLCKDGGTGRKSEREKELQELERAEFIRKKQRQLKEVMSEAEPETQATPLESTEVREERLARHREQEESVAHNVPNTIIVNGQIQIDETSLEIDRHAAAALERNAEQLDAVDENDMTRKVNSATWLKRDKSGGWNELLTERFYDGLRMFGTDFEMISKMFPGRTRHKIKLKFCKEERVNGDRIKATLLGEKLAVDLPELEKMAGTEFDDPEELEKDLEEDRMRLQEETVAEKQAMDEAKRERQQQIAAEQAAAENDSSAKENRRGKGKQKRSKRKKGEKVERSTSRKRTKSTQTVAGAGGGDVLGELVEASRA